MVSTLFKIVILIVLLLGVLYLGACVYVNFLQGDIGSFRQPDVDKAQYQVIIRNTGNVLYTESYSTKGSKITLNGYWELTKGKYKYHDDDIILDKAIFGEITINRRG